MSSSTRVDIVSKEAVTKPGPGQYSHYDEFGKEIKSFTMRGRPLDKAGSEVPGPGNYEADHSAVKDKVIAYKIGSSSRQQVVSREAAMSPGPGHYDSPTRGNGPNVSPVW